MFIGHFALGFAAKRVTPHLSLAMLVAAAQLADLLWPILLLLGVEQVRIDPGNTAFTPLDFVSYPYSHSLLFLVIWGVVFGLAGQLTIGGRKVFGVIAALVVSHWVLDALTHRPDMPLFPGGPKVGLGLWNSVPATLALELPMFAAGVGIYLSTTRARTVFGRWGLAGLVVILVTIYLATLAGTPPGGPVLAVTAVVGALVFVLWSWWVDRHRWPRAATDSG
jgi:hypothetical protein